jgi:class 3 adenylate cyclase
MQQASRQGARSAAAGSRNCHRHQVAVAMADIVKFTRLT